MNFASFSPTSYNTVFYKTKKKKGGGVNYIVDKYKRHCV